MLSSNLCYLSILVYQLFHYLPSKAPLLIYLPLHIYYLCPVIPLPTPYPHLFHFILYWFSVITRWFTLTSKDLELGTSTKGEPGELIILGSDTSLKKFSRTHENSPLKGLIRVVQVIQKWYKLLMSSLIVSQRLKVELYCWRHHYMAHMTQVNQIV